MGKGRDQGGERGRLEAEEQKEGGEFGKRRTWEAGGGTRKVLSADTESGSMLGPEEVSSTDLKCEEQGGDQGDEHGRPRGRNTRGGHEV